MANPSCSGYVCIALPGERLKELNVPMMVQENEDPLRTAYAVTVDYKHGTRLLLFTFTTKVSLDKLFEQILPFFSYLSFIFPLNDLLRN